jgi:tetratricopeptide (TPR) repeat protein
MSAKKKQKFNKQPATKATSAGTTQKNHGPMLHNADNRRRETLFAVVAILTTLVVYLPSLGNGFIVNWDDGGYIQEHVLVHSLSWDNFITIFNPTTFYKGNYHPLTTYFYALEYSMVGENALLYHINNLIFHLINVWLVFLFVKLITKRIEIAGFVALLFGIHPMHVESVAWISERKDVLYTFFFMLSLIQYFYYFTQKESKRKHYALALIFFFLSLLSKSAAVALPVAMFSVDYFMKRKLNAKLFIEKIPFFVLSIVFGLLAVFSQNERGAIHDLTPLFSVLDRTLIVSNSIITYLWKLIVPIQLATMYPYPGKTAGMFPIFLYISPFLVLLLIGLLFLSRRLGRYYIFGALFFFINIALVIQILPVGGASLSERYTYVPYIGLLLILGMLFDKVISSTQKWAKNLKPLLYLVFAGFVLFFSIATWQRIGKWKNGEVLMLDLIKVYPNSTFAYNNLGYLYYHWYKNFDKALEKYNKSMAIDTTNYETWSNRGVVYNNMEKHELAIYDFTKALKYKADNTDAMIGRANSLSAIGKFKEALPDYDNYLKRKPDDGKGYMWRGIAYNKLSKNDQAYIDFEQSRKLLPDNYEVYYWIGLLYYQKEDYKGAIQQFDKALSLDDSKSDIYSWRGLTRYKLNMLDASIEDFNKAISMNPKDGAAFVNRSVSHNDKGEYKQAWDDINSAGKLGFPLDKAYFMKLQAKVGL